MLRKRKGQSTLEYITLFAAIVAAVLLFAWNFMRPAVGNVMGAAANKITNAAKTFK